MTISGGSEGVEGFSFVHEKKPAKRNKRRTRIFVLKLKDRKTILTA